jgi:hypothetical protein
MRWIFVFLGVILLIGAAYYAYAVYEEVDKKSVYADLQYADGTFHLNGSDDIYIVKKNSSMRESVMAIRGKSSAASSNREASGYSYSWIALDGPDD